MRAKIGSYWTDTILFIVTFPFLLLGIGFVIWAASVVSGAAGLSSKAQELSGPMVLIAGFFAFFLWRLRDMIYATIIVLWPIPLIAAVIGGFIGGGWGAVIGAVGATLVTTVLMAMR